MLANRKLLLAATLASALGLAPAASQAAWGVSVTVAPPAPRVVVAPPPRVGFVWVPGYWDWRGRRHVWVEGRWVHARPGYVYVHPEWVQRGDRWVLMRGGWRPMGDHDHDGVPNAMDRHPDNPYRR